MLMNGKLTVKEIAGCIPGMTVSEVEKIQQEMGKTHRVWINTLFDGKGVGLPRGSQYPFYFSTVMQKGQSFLYLDAVGSIPLL